MLTLAFIWYRAHRLYQRQYFADFKNVRFHGGKTFLANPRLFRADAALYFPNLRGTTLVPGSAVEDTTPALAGAVSVVNVFSSLWGENQVRTFMDREHNPGVSEVLAREPGVAQRVRVNVEENPLKAWLVGLFRFSLRRSVPEAEHARYFTVRKGVTERIRYSIGLLNGRVGYIYLLDRHCRIRWAASGDATAEEKGLLVRCLEKLIAEEKELRMSVPERSQARSGNTEPTAQAAAAGVL